MAKDLPLPHVLAQEPALVLPAQRPPQPGRARTQCVDHLPPVANRVRARARDQHQARCAVALGRPRRRVHRCSVTLSRACSAEPARQRAVPRQQRDRGAARNEMQRDVNAGESRTDHQDARGPTRTKRRECAGRPRIQHNPAVGCRAGSQGRHRSEGAFQRVGHATFGASRREHDGVGRQRTPIAQRHARGCARHQPDNLRSLDPHPGGRELFLQ